MYTSACVRVYVSMWVCVCFKLHCAMVLLQLDTDIQVLGDAGGACVHVCVCVGCVCECVWVVCVCVCVCDCVCVFVCVCTCVCVCMHL